MYIRICLLLCLILCPLAARPSDTFPPDSLSRGKAAHGIGLDFRPGYVFPTHHFFAGNNAVGEPISTALSVHLRYAFRFAPDSRFGRLYPHAYQGIGLSYNRFLHTSELGSPVGVYLFQGTRLARLSSRLSLDCEWNFGATFGWKKHDEETNPYNTVVGSRVNAYMGLGIYLRWQLSPQWRLTAGVDGAHYSNGNTHYPNAGVNIVGVRVGVTRAWGNISERADRMAASWHPLSRFSYDLVAYGATRKRAIINENGGAMAPGSFGVVGLNFNPMYVVNRYFRAGLSLDAQYDESANLASYQVENSSSDDMKFYRPPFREQFAVGLSLRAELNMPVFSVNVGVGRNVIYKGEDTKGFYQVLALKAFVTRRLFLHVGYQLYDFQYPNNLMLGLGWRF